MKKLAIKSFLAITAMAWSAQSSAAPSAQLALRDQPRNTPAGLYQHGTPPRSASGVMTQAALDSGHSGFSPTERGLIRSWLRGLDMPRLANAMIDAIPPGTRLGFEHVAQGRALPGWLVEAITSRTDQVIDVCLHGQVFRLSRADHLVIDTV